MPRCRSLTRACILLATTLLTAGHSSAAEPQVAFAVKDGWLAFTLEGGEEPPGSVRVQVIDDRGHQFAEGEAGEDGRGEFPMPSDGSFLVQLTFGKRSADPIRLQRTRAGVEPARVLLSFGLAPCCKAPSRVGTAESASESESATPARRWPTSLLIAGGAFLFLGAALVAFIRRPAAASSTETGAALRRQPSVWVPLLLIGLAIPASLLVVWLVRPAPPPERDLAAGARAYLERRDVRPLSGKLSALLSGRKYRPIPTQAHPLLGRPAPAFTLSDTRDRKWSLRKKLKKGPVVLVFYYGYHCNHCVSQLFALNGDIGKFRELGATVVAVSADPPELTRQRFKKYGEFDFPVLSDPENKVASWFGTYAPSKKTGEDGELMHGTFVIDPRGRIRWANRGDTPFTENRTLLRELHRLGR